MSLTRPARVTKNRENDTSRLFWQPPSPIFDGEYYVRGGICWPGRIPSTAQDVSGYAVLVGINVDNDTAVVFEEMPFSCVDDVIDEKGVIKVSGLSHWFNKNWDTYFADYYYVCQDPVTVKKHTLQVHRSKVITARAGFCDVKSTNILSAMDVVWERTQRRQLKYGAGVAKEAFGSLRDQAPEQAEGVDLSLKLMLAEPMVVKPAGWALAQALRGMEMHPFRKG